MKVLIKENFLNVFLKSKKIRSVAPKILRVGPQRSKITDNRPADLRPKQSCLPPKKSASVHCPRCSCPYQSLIKTIRLFGTKSNTNQTQIFVPNHHKRKVKGNPHSTGVSHRKHKNIFCHIDVISNLISNCIKSSFLMFKLHPLFPKKSYKMFFISAFNEQESNLKNEMCFEDFSSSIFNSFLKQYCLLFLFEKFSNNVILKSNFTPSVAARK